MKKFLKVMGTALLLSAALHAAAPVKTVDQALEDQRTYCGLIVKQSTILHQEKDIPTLTKTRQSLRLLLDRMQREASRLSAESALKPHEDYLLSIEEGITQLARLAEEPMTPENLEQIRTMCDFISVVDQQLLESLGTPKETLYRAAR
jgi:hypothetical protein